MNNIQAILEQEKLTVYGSYFKDTEPPARETVEVSGLPKGVQVEISVTAHF